ncbi:retinoid-binding protein 7 [Loxodonta africana]|uniref:retinoid-binding protein 7 n=1 Tax=Loxodonta africana TaxID=9785 RepID=UPI0030D54664
MKKASRDVMQTRPGPHIGAQSPLSPARVASRPTRPADFRGTWNLLSNDNFEGYMLALGRQESPGQVGTARGCGLWSPSWGPGLGRSSVGLSVVCPHILPGPISLYPPLGQSSRVSPRSLKEAEVPATRQLCGETGGGGGGSGRIDFATYKIAQLLKSQKVTEQNGDSFIIHTHSSLKNHLVKFKVGEEFDEDNKGLGNRKCKSLVTWNNDRLTCVQKGEKKNRGWTHWLEGDKLHLVYATFCFYF